MTLTLTAILILVAVIAAVPALLKHLHRIKARRDHRARQARRMAIRAKLLGDQA